MSFQQAGGSWAHPMAKGAASASACRGCVRVPAGRTAWAACDVLAKLLSWQGAWELSMRSPATCPPARRYAVDQFCGGRTDPNAFASARLWWAANVAAAGLPMIFMGTGGCRGGVAWPLPASL